MATRRSDSPAAHRPSAPAPAHAAAGAIRKAGRAPAPGSAPRTAAAVSPPAAGAKGMLRAGLQALGDARQDVVKRQTRVIDDLLGLGRPPAAKQKSAAVAAAPRTSAKRAAAGADAGFDAQVAAALQRLGLPTADEWQALREEVEQLRAAVAPGRRGTPRRSR